MGLVRLLLPLPRAAARLVPERGGALLGASLLHCVTPSWVALRPPTAARRLAWAEEAVAVYSTGSDKDADGLSRALALRSYALLLSERYAEAGEAADASLAVPDARPSSALTAFTVHLRAQALAGAGRIDEAIIAAGECVELYRQSPAPERRERALGNLPAALRTYGLVLGVGGRTQESVAVYEECAALLAAMSLRELAHVELVRPRVLAELVGGLRVLERYEDALGLGSEAREALRGPIAWSVPGIVLPLRVRLLVDLAHCHRATGDPVEARACAEEAVGDARKLPTGSGLPEALDCLAGIFGELGDSERESTLRRELADLDMVGGAAP
ncbi:hypothetical protein ABZ896_07595 [Streptomyces sp. NPDC047072]|uniref:hypothetical protein n=1 Tax=Streptomyces sp. NPDC047072 TaxID=3154809 RepID=UPI0033D09975